MRVLVVYAHPYEKSYNKALLESTLKGLKKGNHEVDLVDLYEDEFQPVLSKSDLYHASKGEAVDSQIISYQKRFEKAEHVIFIFPIWYESMPAIMKGFLDRVFSNGWAYKSVPGKSMPEGQLKHLKATVVSTMGAPGFIYKLFLNNALEGVLIKGALKFSGIKNVRWHKISNIQKLSDASRKKWLTNIEEYSQKLA